MKSLIEVADKLLEEGYISQQERKFLKTDGNEVVDDSKFIAEIDEKGNVWVWSRGAHPLCLKGYAND